MLDYRIIEYVFTEQSGVVGHVVIIDKLRLQQFVLDHLTDNATTILLHTSFLIVI